MQISADKKIALEYNQRALLHFALYYLSSYDWKMFARILNGRPRIKTICFGGKRNNSTVLWQAMMINGRKLSGFIYSFLAQNAPLDVLSVSEGGPLDPPSWKFASMILGPHTF